MQIIVDHGYRWLNISGLPGSGKTTVLTQAAARLTQSEVANTLILEPASEARILPELIVELEHRARDSGGDESHVLLIDDFDSVIENGYWEDLRAQIQTHSGLRVVTTSLEPQRASEWITDSRQFESVTSAELSFTPSEILAFCAAAAALIPSREPIRAVDQQSLWKTTGGMPGAVALAVDRWYQPERDKYEGFNVELLLRAARWIISMQYPRVILEQVRNGTGQTLSLMPRFEGRHLAMLLGDDRDPLLYEAGLLPLLEPAESLREGHAWKESAWRVFRQWNEGMTAPRVELASKLQAAGDPAAAFDQLILAYDYNGAERLLAKHFVDVFEGFAPELVSQLLQLPPDEIRRATYLRTLFLLLRLEKGDVDAQKAADAVASAESAAGVRRHAEMLLLLRAVILRGLGRTAEALEVIERLFALPRDDAGDPRQERVPAIQLALLLGVLPTGTDDIAMERGADRKHALTIDLLRALRGHEDCPADFVRQRTIRGYRSLICTETWLIGELEKWERIDRVFCDAETGIRADGEGFHDDPPVYLRELFVAARLLAAGNLTKAVSLAESGIAPRQTMDVVRAVVRLAAGRDAEVRSALVEMPCEDDNRRLRAIHLVLRAAVLVRGGKIEQAKKIIADLVEPMHLVAFALSLLPSGDIDSLVACCPSLAPTARIARKAGAAGTGRPLSGIAYIAQLTRREKDILGYLQLGFSDKEISEACYISLSTTKSHLQALWKKLGVRGRQNILARAQALHLL